MDNSDYTSSQGSHRISSATLGQTSTSPQDSASFLESEKRRRPIDDAQRMDLRRHKDALVRENGKWSFNEMMDFFHKKYDRVLSHCTISDSLSDKYKYLDEGGRAPQSSRQRKSFWPDLDAAVYQWEQQLLRRKVTVTNEVLKDMARKLFHELPQYHDVEPPKFSRGW